MLSTLICCFGLCSKQHNEGGSMILIFQLGHWLLTAVSEAGIGAQDWPTAGCSQITTVFQSLSKGYVKYTGLVA